MAFIKVIIEAYEGFELGRGLYLLYDKCHRQNEKGYKYGLE